MADPQNLSNPNFEPTDEQLVDLAKRAFEGVRKRQAENHARLRAEIGEERARVLASLRARSGRTSP